MPDCTNLEKPSLEASSLYGPMGRFVSTYPPSTPVVAVRIRPVSVCVAFTSTPGTARPLESCTVPLICEVACPQVRPVEKAHKTIVVVRVRKLSTPSKDLRHHTSRVEG